MLAFVCVRRRTARSSAGKERNDSRGASLYRWHQHVDAAPREPKIASMSFQGAWFAGTTVMFSVIRGDGWQQSLRHRAGLRRALAAWFGTRLGARSVLGVLGVMGVRPAAGASSGLR